MSNKRVSSPLDSTYSLNQYVSFDLSTVLSCFISSALYSFEIGENLSKIGFVFLQTGLSQAKKNVH